MTSSYVPYERPPQPYTLWSAIPRGLQSFLVPGALLDAKALNDTALLNLTATLPPNFGYVMMDAQVSIAQDVAFNWSNVINLNMQNYFRAAEVDSVALANDWRQNFSINDGLTSTGRSLELLTPWPAFPIIGTPGTSGALIVISASNAIAAAALAGTVNAYISFWQFDLEQVRKYPINSPMPTHPR